MPYLQAVVLILVGVAAYLFGQQSGRMDCPERARLEAEQNARLDVEMAEMFREPMGRELICDQIFESVQGELELEFHLEQEERSTLGD